MCWRMSSSPIPFPSTIHFPEPSPVLFEVSCALLSNLSFALFSGSRFFLSNLLCLSPRYSRPLLFLILFRLLIIQPSLSLTPYLLSLLPNFVVPRLSLSLSLYQTLKLMFRSYSVLSLLLTPFPPPPSFICDWSYLYMNGCLNYSNNYSTN